MESNRVKGSTYEEKEAMEVADKVTDDESMTNKGKTRKHRGKNEAASGDTNGD